MNVGDTSIGTNILPLVSCIMPTFNRRAFVPNAIRYFLQQDYSNKELVIVDDGTDCIEDLVPANMQIRYIRLTQKLRLGEKRNYCIQQAKGDMIMHWDDDDWMAPYRISYQVKELMQQKAEICGTREMFFCELATGKCWLYKYPPDAQPWLAGGSLLYTRKFWEAKPFPDMQVASDTEFIFSRKLESYVVLSDIKFYVASVHRNNTSPRKSQGKLWNKISPSNIKDIVKDDWINHFKIREVNLPAISNILDRKERVAILVTTCDRPAFLQKLLEDINQESGQFELFIFIVDDGKLKNGKKNYWKNINQLWCEVKDRDFDYYIQLPDDVELQSGFIGKAIEAWKGINDPRKICLNLFLEGNRMGATCWTNVWPEIHAFGTNRYLRTQWMDLLFICEKKFFETLQWTIHPIPPERWIHHPHLSSGVGQQVSIRLHNMRWNLYQSIEKLVENKGEISIMNPEVRKREPHRWIHLPPVYAGMATVPEREQEMKKSVESILPYIDRLFIFLNDYQHVPEWITQNKKISPFLSSIENSNMGDAGKFYGLNHIAGNDHYYFALDDDIIYPPSYIWTMIKKINQYDKKVVVGCGGYTMKKEVRHFYNDRQDNWHFSMPNREDRPVHILHTCLVAWHSSALNFHYENCGKPNMGDIWLALAAQKQSVPMILIERPANWVKCQPLPASQTIYGRFRNNCAEQTEVYNSWKDWQLIPANRLSHSVVEIADVKVELVHR